MSAQWVTLGVQVVAGAVLVVGSVLVPLGLWALVRLAYDEEAGADE